MHYPPRMNVPPQTTSGGTRRTLASRDGTPIGYVRLGTGPALVVVHGSISTHADWLSVAKRLSPHFTCFLMDRRGRGLSGPGAEPYSIEREYEDIVALLGSAGPGASLLGHSFGAICALGATTRVPVSRLVLYEPPLPVGGAVAGAHLGDYRRAVEDGNLDQALRIGLTKFVGLPPEMVQAMSSSPTWQGLLPLVSTWVRELEAIDSLGPDLSRYATIHCPILLLVGTRSAPHPLQDASQALAQALPQARVAPLEGQGHMAARTAPELVARVVTSFCNSYYERATATSAGTGK